MKLTHRIFQEKNLITMQKYPTFLAMYFFTSIVVFQDVSYIEYFLSFFKML